MKEEIKRIDIKEFREDGFLQEANRLFFHPLGLALEVYIDEDGNESLRSVWDYRDDPEGNFFTDDMIDEEKILKVETLRQSKVNTRSNKKLMEDYGITINYDGVQLKNSDNYCPDTILTYKRINELLKKEELLDALEAAGVDNWDGWDYAVETLE